MKHNLKNNFPTKYFLLLPVLLFTGLLCFAQLPDVVYKPYIHSVRFFMNGNQLSYPVYNLNSNDQLELEFDDLESDIKSYYYSFQLCDYDWQPVDLNPFIYIKGFTQQRINTYRYSSIAYTRYTHYQAFLPDQSTKLTMSGNYLLKVYLDGDTSNLVFTKRLLVLDHKATISGKVVQTISSQLFQTHQKIQFIANINGLNSFSAAQQIKVVILQNNRWDNCLKDIVPTFVRGNVLDYTGDNIGIFPGGKEWRWLDLRSFSLQSDRVDSGHYKKNSQELFLRTDIDRSSQRYIYYPDYNGMYISESYDNVNPFWETDYATIHFKLAPPDGNAYTNFDIYLAGQLTDYELSDKTKMIFNKQKRVYERTLLLKQGYYNYTYIAVNKNNPSETLDLEGNSWETENNYTILMYYRSFTDRSDQLIGVSNINSRMGPTGVGFAPIP